MTVSVIMIAHNAAATIQEAVSSVMAQSLADFELVLVNDGSEDKTVAAAREVSDDRLRVIDQEHYGRGAARERAVSEARGRFIAVADADDISLPDRLRQQAGALSRDPTLAAVGTQIAHFDASRAPRRLATYPTAPAEVRRAFDRGRMGLPHCSMMIRSEIARRYGYAAECRRAQDLELLLRVAKQWDMANLPEVHVHYRNDPLAMTFSAWHRLHVYGAYAQYRAECWPSQTPVPMVEWLTPSRHLRVLAREGIRFPLARMRTAAFCRREQQP